MTIAHKTEPSHRITLTQLRDMRDSIEAGRIEEVREWVDAAIRFCEGGEWVEVLEEK